EWSGVVPCHHRSVLEVGQAEQPLRCGQLPGGPILPIRLEVFPGEPEVNAITKSTKRWIGPTCESVVRQDWEVNPRATHLARCESKARIALYEFQLPVSPISLELYERKTS